MSLMDKYLKEQKLSKKILDIFRDHLEAETIRGRILSISDALLQVEKFSDEGEYDGVSFIRMRDITRVRSGGREREFIERIALKSNRRPSIIVLPDQNLWEAAVAIQKEAGYVVLLVEDIDPEICFIGEITAHDEEFVLLKEFGTLKTQDRRELIVERHAITRVDFDGGYETTIASIPHN